MIYAITLLQKKIENDRGSFKKALNIALAVVVGTMLGVGVVVLTELLDRRVRSRDDLDRELDVPMLAVLNSGAPAGQRLIGGPRGALVTPREQPVGQGGSASHHTEAASSLPISPEAVGLA